MTGKRIRQWGYAWVSLVMALGLHVADEALTGFLPFYNAAVTSWRETIPWLPLPTFTFPNWLAGLIFGVVALFSISPWVFSGKAFMRPIAYFLSILMIANAFGHMGISIYLGAVAPGAISSPLLLLAAIFLLVTTARSHWTD